MFTGEQEKFMRSIGLDLDFEHLSDDDYVRIEEVVGDKLVQSGLDETYEPNAIGSMCESILDKLG